MRVNPLVVLLFNFVAPVSLMIPGNIYKLYFFFGLASVLLLVSGKAVRLLKFALFTTALYLLSLLSQKLTGNSGNFLSFMFFVNLQFIPCLMMASILVIDCRPGEIISALQMLHLPKIFIVSVVIVIRYIPTFKREFSYISESMRLRNVPFSLLHPARSFSFFIVPQLFRCQLLSDEITAAGMTRGITNPESRTSWYSMTMKFHDWLLLVLIPVGTGVLTIMEPLWK